MHDALLVDEIMSQIFQELEPLGDAEFPPPDPYRLIDSAHSSILLNVALTCRAFSETALDGLWKRIGITDLVRLLLPTCPHTLAASGIPEAKWQLLDKYAKRVHVLVLTGDEIDNDFLDKFSRLVRLRGKPLFPCLRQIFARMCGPLVLDLLAGSSLRDALFFTPDDDLYDATWSFMDVLAEYAPNIRRLYIRAPAIHCSVERIPEMKHLRYLAITQPGEQNILVDGTFFAKLAKLKHLSSIQLYGLDNSKGRTRIQPASVEFPTLKELLIGEDLPMIIPLFESGNFKVLQSLQLQFQSKPLHEVLHPDYEDALWRKLFCTLRQNAGYLTELHIAYQVFVIHRVDMASPWLNHPGQNLSAFPDLLELKLTKFVMQYQLFHSISYSDLDAIAEAWPKLEKLHIRTQTIGDLDFEALAIIRARCPRLQDLAIPLETVGPILRKIEQPVIQGSHPLRTLNVGMCSIEIGMHEQVAVLLTTMFPVISQLLFDAENPSAPTWDEASRLIAAAGC